MADFIEITDAGGTKRKVAVDEVESQFVQRFKMQFGADNSAADVSTGNPLPVGDASTKTLLEALKTLLEGTGTVKVIDGGATIGVDDNGSTLSVDDGGGSVTVDAPLSSPVGVRLSNGSEALASTSGRLHTQVATALPEGNNNIGDVDIASIAAGTNAIGNVGLIPRASGGLTIFRSLDLDETEEQIKATAGQIYFIRYDNRASAERFLKFYNATDANVTVGTTPPILTFPMAKESAGHVPIPQGLAFSTAITVAATTGIADNDTGAPGVNDVVVNIGYA